MSPLPAPKTRNELGTHLAVNAATKPFNVVVPAAATVAGLVLGVSAPLMILIGLVLWLAASSVTFFDADEAEAVGRRLRAPAPKRLAPVHPEVATGLARVEREHARLLRTVTESDHSMPELVGEADGVMELATLACGRASALRGVLDEGDHDGVRRRIQSLERKSLTPAEAELLEALRVQDRNLSKAADLVAGFEIQMERLAVELAGVRSGVVTMASVSSAALDERLASEARLMRERVGTMAESMQDLL